MLTPEKALEKREFMLREGYVLLENILPDAFLEELRAETERLIAGHVEAPELRFQGQHIPVKAVRQRHHRQTADLETRLPGARRPGIR